MNNQRQLVAVPSPQLQDQQFRLQCLGMAQHHHCFDGNQIEDAVEVLKTANLFFDFVKGKSNGIQD